jgi:predicted nucleic acid-binding protein
VTYLIDTDWVADWLTGRAEAIRLLSSLRSQGLAISLITFGEIYERVYFRREPRTRERTFREFLRFVQSCH